MRVRLTTLICILSLVMTPFVSTPFAGSARAADTPNHRIQRSSATGTFLGAWGSQGTGDGQFDRPRGVAVAPDGTVYVADSRNSRIQRFSATGTFLGTWGSPGGGDGQFIEPEGIAVAPDGTVYTVDFDGRVQRFNATGTFLGAWEVESSGNVGVAPDGTVYVTESSWYRVRRFSATGAPLDGWGSPGGGDGQFSEPRGVAVAPDGTVYVVDSDLGHRIQRFSATGTFLGTWGSPGSGDGQFVLPRGVAVAPDGTVYVADTGNHRIQVFSADGTFLGKWGSEGSGNGQFKYPEGVAVAPDGAVYVADTGNHRIQVFRVQSLGTSTPTPSSPTPTSSPVMPTPTQLPQPPIPPSYRAFQFAIGAQDPVGQFDSPDDVAVAPDGTVYVVDSGNHRIQRFSASGEFLGTWGARGSGDGQFDNPSGVAVAPDRTVYVTDYRNNRIQRFSASGTFLGKWGVRGSGDGQFKYPESVAVAPDGTVYVADAGNHRIQVFSADGTFLGKWGSQGSGNGQFKSPEGVAVAPDGTVYVADFFDRCIQRFSADGTFLSKWELGSSYGPYVGGVAVAPDGTVYVADTGNRRIQRFSADGTFLGEWGSLGRGDGQFLSPRGVAVAPDGTVYVADDSSNRIQHFSASGTFLGKWGSQDSGDGRFRWPSGVAVTPDGTVYVADSSRIQRFRADGTFLGAWGSGGRGDGQFWLPEGVAVAPDGAVYVADTDNHRVQRFRADGTFLGTWGAPGEGDGEFYEPSGVAVGSDGAVYVADRLNHRIQVFSADGTFLSKWGSQGSGDGQFIGPEGIAVAPDGTVYVVDSGNHRIQHFSATGAFLGAWRSEAGGVAVAPDGTVYVVDSGNHRIQHFSATGAFLGKWGSEGSGDGQFKHPGGVAVGSDGMVYVADTDNHRIQVFGTAYPNAWRGEFFANDWLAGPVLHVENVFDLFLNRSWLGQPAATIPADHFTSRWLRYVNFPTSGRYRFTIRADDGVRFWVDDRLVVDSWQPQSLTREVTVELLAGYHRLLLEHWDRDGSATLALAWARADNATPTPSLVTPTPARPPQPPSNLRVINVSAGSITLTWQDNANNETGFYLDRWYGGTWRQIAMLKANVTTYKDETGLVCGQSYRYRVSAYNAAGRSAASEVTTTTERCPLILVPGIMGSYIHKSYIFELWPGVFDDRRDDDLRDLGSDRVIVRDAIRTYVFDKLPRLKEKYEIYTPLIRFLKSTLGYVEYPDVGYEEVPITTPLERCQEAKRIGKKPTLFVFAYDWRQSNRESAKQLKKYIACVRSIHNGSRVDIIAHSMGGLVARRYLIDSRHAHHVSRLITIATPFYGAARATTAITTGHFPGLTDIQFKERRVQPPKIFGHELRYVAEKAAGAHELLPSRAYFEAYFEQQQCPLVFLDEYNELWETKYSYRCASHDEFTGWINEKAAGSGDNAARFHAESQDDWRNDKDLLEFVPTYYHIVSTDRKTLSGVASKKLCTQLSPFGSFAPYYMCSHHLVDMFYDSGDGTVPARSGEHARYRNPQAQVIKVSGEHTEMLSGEELRDHLRRILLGSETGASQPGETARSGHVSVAGMLHPQATTFTLPPVASNEQTTFFNTALDTPPEHTRRETVAYAALPTPAASDTPPVADMHYLRAINVVSLTITDRTGRFPSAVTFDHLDDGVYAAVVPPDDVYTATITLKAREGAIIEMRTGTNDITRRAVRYLDIFPAQRNRQVQVVFFQNGFSLLRQDTDADGLFETEIPPTAEISGDAANDREPPVVDVRASGPLDARTITITATDVSGVANIRYSFDGITFRSYTGPFVVDATQTPVIYTFADDRAANRSELLAYPLSWKVYLPLTIR